MPDGRTISWSPKTYSKQYATFQLPCGKCIECRLDYARQWAIRCVHEAQMHQNNSFVTLTYSDDKLKSPYLQYEDFQLFMKKLRKLQNDPIGYFVTGEYGELSKRPHWHAIMFGYRPNDSKEKYKSPKGDQVWESDTLTKIWGHGIAEFGSVTFESAGYCARYAAKKLAHGNDEDHEYQPISKKSSKHAIGKKWLEKHWEDIFLLGKVVLPDGRAIGSIPRYYEKWLQQNRPDDYHRYVTETKNKKMVSAEVRAAEEKQAWIKNKDERLLINWKRTFPKTRQQVQEQITEIKFQQLQNYLKLK